MIPVSGRSPGGGNGNALQHSCLENPVDRRAWWTTKESDMIEHMAYHTYFCLECFLLLLADPHPAPRQQNFFLSELFHLLKEQGHSLSLLSLPLPPYFSLPLVNIPNSALPLLTFRFCSPTFLYASTCNILQKNSSEHFAQPSILAALCL